MLSRTILLSAGGAALANLGITLPKLIYVEATAATMVAHTMKLAMSVDGKALAESVKKATDTTTG